MVFPAPLSPTRARHSPRGTTTETRSSATTVEYRRLICSARSSVGAARAAVAVSAIQVTDRPPEGEGRWTLEDRSVASRRKADAPDPPRGHARVPARWLSPALAGAVSLVSAQRRRAVLSDDPGAHRQPVLAAGLHVVQPGRNSLRLSTTGSLPPGAGVATDRCDATGRPACAAGACVGGDHPGLRFPRRETPPITGTGRHRGDRLRAAAAQLALVHHGRGDHPCARLLLRSADARSPARGLRRRASPGCRARRAQRSGRGGQPSGERMVRRVHRRAPVPRVRTNPARGAHHVTRRSGNRAADRAVVAQRSLAPRHRAIPVCCPVGGAGRILARYAPILHVQRRAVSAAARRAGISRRLGRCSGGAAVRTALAGRDLCHQSA